METIEYRRARPEDAAATLDLQRQLFPTDPNVLVAEDFSADKTDGPIIIIAAQDTEILGFCVLRDRSKRPWTSIDFVGVAESGRGKGIGRELLACTFAAASRPVVRLFVAAQNTAARALYKRLGFMHTGTKKNHYPDGDDALVMMRLKFSSKSRKTS